MPFMTISKLSHEILYVQDQLIHVFIPDYVICPSRRSQYINVESRYKQGDGSCLQPLIEPTKELLFGLLTTSKLSTIKW